MSDSTQSHHPPESDVALALRAKQAAAALGIGERKLWELTNRNEIPHVRLGRAVIYPVAELRKWLSDRASKSLRECDG